MIAYNSVSLANIEIKKQSEDLFDEGCISKEELAVIKKKYPVEFYSPNVFIAVGLLILTIIVLLFSFGVLALFFRTSDGNMFGMLAIIFSIPCFLALEYMIRAKKHYSSGVDEGLLWGGSMALCCGISLPHDLSGLANCIIICLISLLGVIRYADRLMAAVVYCSFLGILFYSCVELGTTGKAIAPFIIMIAAIASYFIAITAGAKAKMVNYRNCFTIVEIISLISLYAAGNYFVVRELSNEMFNLHLQPADTIPFGWLFWIFTSIIPITYLVIGIKKKALILVRVGLLLLAAIVFTVRYYHSILPTEVLMTICGILLFAIAYALMKWLHAPVYGFTSRVLSSRNEWEKLQIESLILAETFKPGTDAPDSIFGGGSFGGGGASGEF